VGSGSLAISPGIGWNPFPIGDGPGENQGFLPRWVFPRRGTGSGQILGSAQNFSLGGLGGKGGKKKGGAQLGNFRGGLKRNFKGC